MTLTVKLPGAEPVELGSLRPRGRGFSFRTHITVPVDSPAGVATVGDGLGHGLRFRIARG